MSSFVVAAATMAALPVSAAEVSGHATITDGDTVIVGGKTIRLQGIDAPETDQVCLGVAGKYEPCGIEAREALRAKVGQQAWRCQLRSLDRYGRSLGTCYAGGINLNQWLVREGWALSYLRYSHAYAADEAAARAARKGMWRGSFVAPWDWRYRNCKTTVLGAVSVPIDAERKLCGSPDVPPQKGCEIKANLVSKTGQCIYRQPGERGYGKLKMSKRGRRWFCTKVEAEAAACRAARR